VPDFLFFADERNIDLNKTYGTRNKRYKVRGILNILDSYKFTIHENTPIEEEVALDPELLGKVFENLLAAYNPETGATARKQTGSFYTPREIVNYMVDESLIAYLESKLKDRDMEDTEKDSINERLRHLITYNDEPPRFSEAEVGRLIEAIDTVQILDPACGSGAFPMGILHKLVFILGKLDPGNEQWKAKQIAKANEIPDSTIRETVVAEIEQAFERNELDYGRKLYLIENCIYGVDIQPIATQIAKLRFFISLVVDQKIDDTQVNRGIIPLPNLETKFVAANTLIGIDSQLSLRTPEIAQKEEDLADVRRRHFTARTRQTKAKHRNSDAQLRSEISELLKRSGFPSETTEKLAFWDPYDQNASADFFDPEWMFGISSGFSVVIGNPPYFVYQGHKKDEIEILSKIELYQVAKGGKLNAYKLFLAKGLALAQKNTGLLSFIFQNSFLADNSASKIRQFVLDEHKVIKIDSFPERDNTKKRVFEPVKMSVCILLCKRKKVENYSFEVNIWEEKQMLNKIHVSFYNQEIKSFDPKKYTIPSISSSEKLVLVKLYHPDKTRVSSIINCIEGELNMTFHRHLFNNNQKNPKIIKGAQVQRYYLTDDMSQGVIEYVDKERYLMEFTRSKKANHHFECRIVMQGITGVNDKRRLIMALLDPGYFCANSCNYILLKNTNYDMKFILGLYNSTLLNWAFRKTSTNSNVNCYEIESLPVPRQISTLNQQKISKLVDEILTAKRTNPDADTSALEREIDQLVYALYDLTPEEIAIVEGEMNKTKEEPQTVKEKVEEIRYRVRITKEQAEQGVRVAIPTGDDKKITIRLPAGVSDGKQFRVKDRNLLVIASVEG
ncbi:Eco57I restriction-modification methylase domain-containing protein, partial [bacterium]|nr:Eco57I restriction-modification methylase domain-containing protein [bacterium]